MAHLVENEKTKLIASALDRVSTGCFVVGILGPYAAVIYGTSPTLGGELLLFSALCWFAIGVYTHTLGQWVLESLLE